MPRFSPNQNKYFVTYQSTHTFECCTCKKQTKIGFIKVNIVSHKEVTWCIKCGKSVINYMIKQKIEDIKALNELTNSY